MSSSLEALRNQLTIKERLFSYKRTNVRAQHAHTRMLVLLQGNQEKINTHADQYRTAYKAFVCLGGHLEHGFKELLAKDVTRPEGETEDGNLIQRGEGKRVASWIWSTAVDNEAIMQST